MSILWFLAAVVLVVCMVTQWGALRRQRQITQTLQLQVEKMDAETRNARSRTEQLESENRNLRSDARALEMDLNNARFAYNAAVQMTNAPGAQKQPGVGGKSSGNPGAFLAEMMNDPDMRKAMEQQQAMMLDMMYAPLFKQLNLTPEEAEKLKAKLIGQQMENMTQAQGMFDQNSTNRAARIQQIGERHKAMQDEIKSLLGEERYKQYEDYNQTVGERTMLSQFSQQTKLQPEQVEQLLAIIGEEKKSAQSSGGFSTDPGQNWQEMMQNEQFMEQHLIQQEGINAAVIERARSVLDAEQLDSFARFQTNMMMQQKLGISMAKKMFGSEEGTGGSPPPQPVPEQSRP